MLRTMIAALAVSAVAACGRGDRRDVASADSLNRDLQLAPVDTTAPVAPSADTAAAPAAPTADTSRPAPTPAPKPTPKPATRPTPKPTPKPAPPASSAAPSAAPSAATPSPAATPSTRELGSGTTFSASTDSEIRSNKNKVGDEITATVARDVKDASGQVVIPAGAKVTLQVTALHESENKRDTTGTLTLKPTSVSINGKSQPVDASISGVATKLEGRGTGAGDVAKPAAGAAAGAIVGRVLGGSTKGAIIGGIIGGAVGAQRAVETKDRDVVLPQGTAVTFTLNGRFVAQS